MTGLTKTNNDVNIFPRILLRKGKKMRYSVSSGGIIVNPQGKIIVVYQRGVSWSLPKGHVHSNESPLAAARREIREETGLRNLTVVKELGRYGRYKIGKRGRGEDRTEFKIIYMFLFSSRQAALVPEEDDVSEARWVSPKKAISLLTHAKDKAFLKKHLKEIKCKTAH